VQLICNPEQVRGHACHFVGPGLETRKICPVLHPCYVWLTRYCKAELLARRQANYIQLRLLIKKSFKKRLDRYHQPLFYLVLGNKAPRGPSNLRSYSENFVVCIYFLLTDNGYRPPCCPKLLSSPPSKPGQPQGENSPV